jgi:hypothetical protein
MAVSLLRTSNIVSLEFATEDRGRVKTALRELFGKIEVARHVTWACVTVDGEDFTFQNEWDDPCLITSTSKGAEMLTAVAAHLGHTPT